MEWKNTMVVIIGAAVTMVGAFSAMYHIYKMTVIDANARGLKHPKLWGMVAINGNNSGGLIMYLIGRKKYPIKHITESDTLEIERRKKAVGVSFIFLVIGAIAVVLYLTLS